MGNGPTPVAVVGYYDYYPYHDGPGVSSSLAPMLVLALLFIGMLLLFSWAAYADYRRARGAGDGPDVSVEHKHDHIVRHDWKRDRGHPGWEGDYVDDMPYAQPVGPPGFSSQWTVPRASEAPAPPSEAHCRAQPVGQALTPPWARGAPVGGGDVRAAMMSSASVSGFFKSR